MTSQEQQRPQEKPMEKAPEQKRSGVWGKITDSFSRIRESWQSGKRVEAKKQSGEAVHLMAEVAHNQARKTEASIRNAAAEAKQIDGDVDAAQIEADESALIDKFLKREQDFDAVIKESENEIALVDDDFEEVDDLADRRAKNAADKAELKTDAELYEALQAREKALGELGSLYREIKIQTTDIMNEQQMGVKNSAEIGKMIQQVETLVGAAGKKFADFIKQPPAMKDRELSELLPGNPMDLMTRAAGLKDGLKNLQRRADIAPEQKMAEIVKAQKEQQNVEAVGVFKAIIDSEGVLLKVQMEKNNARIKELKSSLAEAKKQNNEIKVAGLKKEIAVLQMENLPFEEKMQDRLGAFSLKADSKAGASGSSPDSLKPLSWKERLAFKSTAELQNELRKVQDEWRGKALQARRNINFPNAKGYLGPDTTLEEMRQFHKAAEDLKEDMAKKEKMSADDQEELVYQGLTISMFNELLALKEQVALTEAELYKRAGTEELKKVV